MAIELSDHAKATLIKATVFVAVVIGAQYGADFYAGKYFSSLEQENDKLQNELAEVKSQLARIVDEERQQQLFVEKYLAYDRAGLIKTPREAGGVVIEQADEELRLAWLSRLQEIRTDRKFFKFTYDISPPSIVDPQFSEYTKDSTVAIRTNELQVNFTMLHELDALMLINDFYDNDNNPFVNTRCVMYRNVEDTEFVLELQENLVAECSMIWITVFDDEKAVEGLDESQV